MSTNARITEIVESMNTLRKTTYYNEEILQSLLDLEEEVVSLTFAEGHADRMRFLNVVRHFDDLNNKYGNVADNELQRFKAECEQISGRIAMEISGKNGERTVFRSLETIKAQRNILQNVEISQGENRAELDAVIVTPKAIFHVEIKNPKHDTTIDARGNFYQTENPQYINCNLGEKIRNHAHLLRSVINESQCLGDAKPLEIKSYVVSANSRVEFVNQFQYVESCYYSQFPFIIDEYDGESLYTSEDMDAIAACIRKAEIKRAYPIGFDVNQFRHNYATLMATLEAAAESKIEVETKNVTMSKKESCANNEPTTFYGQVFDFWNAIRNLDVMKFAGCALSGIVIGLLTSTVSKRL